VRRASGSSGGRRRPSQIDLLRFEAHVLALETLSRCSHVQQSRADGPGLLLRNKLVGEDSQSRPAHPPESSLSDRVQVVG